MSRPAWIGALDVCLGKVRVDTPPVGCGAACPLRFSEGRGRCRASIDVLAGTLLLGMSAEVRMSFIEFAYDNIELTVGIFDPAGGSILLALG